MKYQVFLVLDRFNFFGDNWTFQAFSSTEQAGINKVRKQAKEAGFNELNSSGRINIYRRKNSEYDDNYYYVTTVLAW